MQDNKNDNERFNFVNELLTGEELLERLAAAQEVVQALTAQIEARNVIIHDQRNLITWRDDRIEWFRKQMRAMALDLARSGGYDHKGKNERMLAVITTLLELAIPRVIGAYFTSDSGIDDVPF